MIKRSLISLILPLCLLTTSSYAQATQTKPVIYVVDNVSVYSNTVTYTPLSKTNQDPSVIINNINQHIHTAPSEEAYMMIIDLVQSLKTYQQHLYQKLNNPLTQKMLANRNTSLQSFLSSDIYNKGYRLKLNHGQYIPTINLNTIEQYYPFLTTKQIQHIQHLLTIE